MKKTLWVLGLFLSYVLGAVIQSNVEAKKPRDQIQFLNSKQEEVFRYRDGKFFEKEKELTKNEAAIVGQKWIVGYCLEMIESKANETKEQK